MENREEAKLYDLAFFRLIEKSSVMYEYANKCLLLITISFLNEIYCKVFINCLSLN